MVNAQQLAKRLQNIPVEKLLIISKFIDMVEKRTDQESVITEMNDEEIILAAEKAGTFDFLNEPEEDIYTLEDGIPL